MSPGPPPLLRFLPPRPFLSSLDRSPPYALKPRPRTRLTNVETKKTHAHVRGCAAEPFRQTRPVVTRREKEGEEGEKAEEEDKDALQFNPLGFTNASLDQQLQNNAQNDQGVFSDLKKGRAGQDSHVKPFFFSMAGVWRLK